MVRKWMSRVAAAASVGLISVAQAQLLCVGPEAFASIDGLGWSEQLTSVRGDNGLLYVRGFGDMRVIDDSVDGSPVLVSDADFPVPWDAGGPFGVVGGRVVSLDLNAGVSGLDLLRVHAQTELGSWEQIATLDVGSVATGLYTYNGLAFVPCGAEGVRVIGVLTLNTPIELSRIVTRQPPWGVAAVGDVVFITTSEGIEKWDLADPTEPVLLRRRSLGFAANIAVSDGRVFVESEGQLLVLDSDRDAGLATLSSVTGSFAIISGRTALIPSDSYQSELMAADFSEPGPPVVTGPIWLDGLVSSLVGLGDGRFAYREYVSNDIGTFDPARLVWFRAPTGGTMTVPWRLDPGSQYPWDIGLGDGVMYISQRVYDSSPFSVAIYSLNDPLRPVRVGTLQPLPSNHRVEDMIFAGDWMYASHSSSGIMVTDVSNPENPTIVRNVPVTPTEIVFDLQMIDGRLFAAAGRDGLFVYDLADPSLPSQVGFVDTRVEVVAGAGDRVYVLDATDRMRVYDFADPASPLLLHAFPQGIGTGLLALDEHTLVSHGAGSFKIVDMTDPTVQEVLSDVRLPSALQGFYEPMTTARVEGNRLYVSGTRRRPEDGVLAVYDISDRTSPELLGKAFPGNISAMHARDGVVYAGIGRLDGGFPDFQTLTMDTNRCCPADLAAPLGELNLFDVITFLSLFSDGEPGADFSPDGVFDLFDIIAFLSDFNAGCD